MHKRKTLFFRRALNAVHTQGPHVINVDKKCRLSRKQLNELRKKEELFEQVELRQNKYLNNRLLA